MAETDDSPQPLLAGRALTHVEVAAGSRLYRSHPADFDPIYFGKGRAYRFDDPAGTYGVFYAAHRLEGAFVETFLRRPGRTYLDRGDLARRSLSAVKVNRALQLLPLHGPHLVQAGATAEVTHGPADQYTLPQRWSAAIHDHGGFDGIEYRSRHDDELLCVALFDRARSAIEPAGLPVNWMADADLLGKILDRYGVALG
jgi:hypothetical protein